MRTILLFLLILTSSFLPHTANADVLPSSGPIFGGTPITITGSNFVSVMAVYVGGEMASGVVTVNSTTITAVTPESYSEGTVDVDVETMDDYISFPATFTYIAPTISSVTPDHGTIVGGTAITISGTLFNEVDSMIVDFGGNYANNLVLVNDNTITATTPEGMSEGPVTVEIQYPNFSISLDNGFTYMQPSINSITPPSGTVNGGFPVTISGAYFVGDVSVEFGGDFATEVTLVDSNTITALIPPGMPGQTTVDLTVGGGMGYTSSTFTYIAPTIESIIPNSGYEIGGTEVTITGTLFEPTAVVKFGLKTASATFVDSNTITAITPNGSGVVDVSVSTDYSQADLSQGFTYTVTPTPQIINISPQSGYLVGGTPVIISGTDFLDGAIANLGGVSISNLSYIDSTTLIGDTPALGIGTYDLTVINPGNKTGVLTDVFTVISTPLELTAGDLAPRGEPDNQLNVADLIVLQQLILGNESPSNYEQLVGDVGPLNNPDGELNVGDYVILQRAVMGEIALPPIYDTAPPQISIISPVNGSTLTQPTVEVIGIIDEPATVHVGGNDLGQVTYFSTSVILQQGVNAITVTATDLSGNTTNTIINLSVDSRAPVPLNISNMTVTQPGSGQVSFTGSTNAVEPGTTIQFINTTTSAIVTVIADGNGAFTRQFGANEGDIIQIEILDAAGNTSQSTAYIVGAQIQIVTPLDSATFEGSETNVSGIFLGGLDSGVMVNNIPGCMYGNSFYINEFPLQSGSNTLTATLTDPAGSTNEHSISITGNDNLVPTLGADDDCGIAPLTVNFSLGTAGVNIQQIDIDFDGDGVPDYTTTDANAAMSTTYFTPGVYPATAWILDDQGVEYEMRLNIVAQDESVQDALLQQVWSNFSGALATGDVDTALQSIRTQLRGFYGPILEALSTNLPEIAGDLSGIKKIQLSEDLAEYAILTVVDGQVSTFVITFTKDSDGIWRILSM